MSSKTEILVVGGAGYIGSHMCKALAVSGYQPVVLDNLIYGHREAVKWGPLFEGEMADEQLFKAITRKHRIVAVMHFAAFAYVGESVSEPQKYYRNNVADTITLLESMLMAGIDKFIFSSTCATYGEPCQVPMDETHAQNPINPYGRTKFMVEQILNDFRTGYGFNSVALRYFNAAGADADGELGEDHDPETHLIPLVLQAALGQRPEIQIFGDDYPTADGTCIRDYIHIMDLAQAHLLALEALLDGDGGGAYNLGNGGGYSVKEVVETARRITGKNVPATIAARRAGDPAALVGSSTKVREKWGWRPEFPDLDAIISTAWAWHRRHPYGYSR